MRREGMAAWLKSAHRTPDLPPSMPAVHRPPAPAAARNELALLLASLVVKLSAESSDA
jgi:hypothetical protein